MGRLGENVSRGPHPKDLILDKTVLFKTVIGLKWIMWMSGKIAFGAGWAKVRPRGFPPRTPFWTKPFDSKLSSASFGLNVGTEKSLCGWLAQVYPKGFPLRTHFWTKPFCSKPSSALSRLYGGPGKIACGQVGRKCVPGASP